MSDQKSRANANANADRKAAPTSLSAALAAGLKRPGTAKAAKAPSDRVFVPKGDIVQAGGGVALLLPPQILDNPTGRPTTDKDGNLLGFSLGTVQARYTLDDGGQLFVQATITRHLPKG